MNTLNDYKKNKCFELKTKHDVFNWEMICVSDNLLKQLNAMVYPKSKKKIEFNEFINYEYLSLVTVKDTQFEKLNPINFQILTPKYFQSKELNQTNLFEIDYLCLAHAGSMHNILLKTFNSFIFKNTNIGKNEITDEIFIGHREIEVQNKSIILSELYT